MCCVARSRWHMTARDAVEAQPILRRRGTVSSCTMPICLIAKRKLTLSLIVLYGVYKMLHPDFCK